MIHGPIGCLSFVLGHQPFDEPFALVLPIVLRIGLDFETPQFQEELDQLVFSFFAERSSTAAFDLS